jgi:hypothetical protein
MRVGVVGNCQSGVMASLLTAMLPDTEIVHHSITQPKEAYGDMAADLATCDVIISQFVSPEYGPLSTKALTDAPNRLIMVPNLAFTGFFPDITYLFNQTGAFISPAGFYHSKIIIASFMLGLTPARTAKLFNAYIYHQLGYFDEFDMAEEHFESTAANCGFTLRVKDLMHKGVFMHTINHPALSATESLTLEAAEIAGLSPRTDYAPLTDVMIEDTIWPVYPEIASRIGLSEGSMIFRMSVPMAHNRAREITLEEMIEVSFSVYSAQRDDIDYAPIQKIANTIGSLLCGSYA